MISTEQATVYRGGGRRWFTLQAAQRAEARTIIKRRCECCKGDHITPDYVCDYHDDPVKFDRMTRLLVAMFIRKAKV